MAINYPLNEGLDDHGQPPGWINLRFRKGREIDELLGLCRGILSDGSVNQKEAEFLNRWILSNSDIATVWPTAQIAARLSRILTDGVVSDEELNDLQLLLERVTTHNPEGRHSEIAKVPMPNLPTLALFDEPAPDVVFRSQGFCFTGRFLSGTRKWCWDQVAARGGIVSDAGNCCAYLVIGELGSRDWKHSSYGRKIQAAADQREVRKIPAIIPESHWAKFL